MRELYLLALAVLSKDQQADDAMDECRTLSGAVMVWLYRERKSPAYLAASIARMEIICQRLRLLVGDDLVDLEKVEAHMHLAKYLRDVTEKQEVQS